MEQDTDYLSNLDPDQQLSEADTKAKLIDPVLKEAGWSEEQIRREYPITEGRVIKKDGQEQRADPQYADYILTYQDYPLAVIEAKRTSMKSRAGIEQAKNYAQRLGVQFAYSSNGYGFFEYNFFTKEQRFINEFPTPEELWIEINLKAEAKESTSPLLIPYHYDPVKDIKPRYYQEAAINKTIESVLAGDKYILLTMATGTGKTYTALQIVWKLVEANYCQRVLFLADRNILRNQAYSAFDAFEEGARCIIESGRAPKSGRIYFSIYQALYSGEEKKLYQEYESDFFDLIIIDECHRSGFGSWNEILQYFDSAIQLGLTATPKRSDNIDTYEYFGNPVYTYSMKQGIEDGYLAIYNIKTNLDAEGLDLEEVGIEAADLSKRRLTTKDFERVVTIPDRSQVMVNYFTIFLINF